MSTLKIAAWVPGLLRAVVREYGLRGAVRCARLEFEHRRLMRASTSPSTFTSAPYSAMLAHHAPINYLSTATLSGDRGRRYRRVA
jgi:hypothetical protein